MDSAEKTFSFVDNRQKAHMPPSSSKKLFFAKTRNLFPIARLFSLYFQSLWGIFTYDVMKFSMFWNLLIGFCFEKILFVVFLFTSFTFDTMTSHEISRNSTVDHNCWMFERFNWPLFSQRAFVKVQLQIIGLIWAFCQVEFVKIQE